MDNAIVTVTEDHTEELFAALEELTSQVALVGFPEDKAVEREDGNTNASLAYLHEHGSPAQRIPPRPFMEQGIDHAQADIVAALAVTAEAAVNFETEAITPGFEAAGAVAAQGIQATLLAGVQPPLAPSTLRSRHAKGQGTIPLVATRQMVRAVTHTVRHR